MMNEGRLEIQRNILASFLTHAEFADDADFFPLSSECSDEQKGRLLRLVQVFEDEFYLVGKCIPSMHYMVDISRQVEAAGRI